MPNEVKSINIRLLLKITKLLRRPSIFTIAFFVSPIILSSYVVSCYDTGVF